MRSQIWVANSSPTGDDVPVRADAGCAATERVDRLPAPTYGSKAHTRIFYLGSTDEFVDRNRIGARERKEEFERRAAMSRLEPGERAQRDPYLLRDIGERAPALGPDGTESAADGLEGIVHGTSRLP